MKRRTAAAVALLFPALALGAYLQWLAPNVDSPAGGMRMQQRLPVLLVHGSGMSSSVWTALMHYLRAHGWPEEYLLAVDLVPDNGSNIAAAEQQLQPAAHALLERAAGRAATEGRVAPRKIAVVGHSMGAVSGRWLAAKLIPEQVSVVVAIAGPNRGSSALCGRAGEGDRELCHEWARTHGSVVLRELNGMEVALVDETPYGPAGDPPGVTRRPPTATACIAWYTVMIDPDEWIVPASSARLAGSGGAGIARLPVGIERLREGEFVLRAPARHDDLPATPPVMKLVTSMLQASTAACRR